MRSLTFYWLELVNFSLFLLQYLPSTVARTVINHNDLMRYAAQLKLEVKVFNSGCNTTLLIAGWNYHGD